MVRIWEYFRMLPLHLCLGVQSHVCFHFCELILTFFFCGVSHLFNPFFFRLTFPLRILWIFRVSKHSPPPVLSSSPIFLSVELSSLSLCMTNSKLGEPCFYVIGRTENTRLVMVPVSSPIFCLSTFLDSVTTPAFTRTKRRLTAP